MIHNFINESGVNPQDIDYDDKCFYANLYNIPNEKRADYIEKMKKITRLETFMGREEITSILGTEHPEVKNLD